ncbi:T9SS type A sorting domain-containing protein [candidate division WOR-3 bacterium]|nr:T9SS type A sorting domain-containing protein [candidate division WOR-3 bacterium]
MVSHPKWGDITFDGDSTDERGSILHCFRGSPPANPSKEFDCFDIKDHYPDGIWNGDPGNPAYFVSYGSDLVFGKVSYSWSGPTGSREGIWASFGNSTGQWYLGFRYRVQFPWWQEEGGGQSAPSGHPGTRGVTVGPNPVRGAVSFQSLCRGSGTVAIYTIAGQHVRSLTLLDGRCTWDLNDNDTRTVPEGIYFYLVRAGRNELRGKMTVQR